MPAPALTFPMQLSLTTRKEFEAFLAQLNEGYLLSEHKDDGSHGDITVDSITMAQTSTSTNAGEIRLFDEMGREVILDATNGGSESNQVLRISVSDDLIANDPGELGRGTAAWLGVVQPTGPGNAFGPGLVLRKPSTPATATDGWAMSVSETDSLLTGTSMLAITDLFDGNIVLLLRPIGVAGSVSSYVLSPKAAYAIGSTVDLGRNSSGERFQNIYGENITANTSFSAAIVLATQAFVLVAQDTTGARIDLESGEVAFREGDDSAYLGIRALNYIVGSADTNGIRLDVGSGVLRVREGDNSDPADVTVRRINFNATTATDPMLRETSAGVLGVRLADDSAYASLETLHTHVTGTLIISDGSVGTPAVIFNSDTDTGLYRVGSNQLGVSCGGSSAALFDAAFTYVPVILTNDGSSSAPSHSFTNDTDTGIYRIGSNQLGITTGTTLTAAFAGTQVGIQDGTVSAPALTFQADSDLGLYRVGSNQLGVTCGNSLAAYFDASFVFATRTLVNDGSAGSPSTAYASETDMGMYRSGSREISWAIAGGQRMLLTFPSGDVTSLYLNQGSFSAGAVNGCGVRIGRNSGGNGAAGWVGFMAAGGTEYAVWADATGDLRIHTAAPTANNAGSDTAGTVVGDQTSERAAKNILGRRTDYQHALQTILDTPIFDFTYKNGRYNGEKFTGLVTDESPVFGKDHGKSLNEASCIGYLMNAIKAQQQQIDDLKAEVASLRQKLA